MKTTLNCENYFDRTLLIFVRRAVLAAQPRTQDAKITIFSNFRIFEISTVCARAGSAYNCVRKQTFRKIQLLAVRRYLSGGIRKAALDYVVT